MILPMIKGVPVNITMAYSYKRCSDPKQSKGRSMARQDFAARVCLRQGWTLDTNLRLVDDGKSAFRGLHRMVGALGRFLDLVKAKRILPGSVLIIEDQDRFSREEVFDALDVWMDLLKRDVAIYVETFDQVFSRETINANPMLLQMAVGSMTRAHQESARKSEMIKDWWDDARAKARGKQPISAICPGYMRLNREEGSYEFVADRLELLRRMIQRVLDGLGLDRVAGELNAEEVPRWGKAALWNKAYLHKLLTSRALVGEGQPRSRAGGKSVPVGDPIPGYYPAVLTEGEYARLVAVIRGRKLDTGPKHDGCANLFTGIVHAQPGGAHMRIGYSHPHGRVYAYLDTAAGGGGGVAGEMRVRYDYFERVVLIYLREITAADLTPQAQPDEAGQLRARFEERSRYLSQVEDDLSREGADYGSLRRVATRVEAQVRDLAGQLAAATARAEASSAGTLQQAQTVIQALADAKGAELHDLRTRLKGRIRELVKRVEVKESRQSRCNRTIDVRLIFAAGAERTVRYRVGLKGVTEHGWLAVGGELPAAEADAI